MAVLKDVLYPTPCTKVLGNYAKVSENAVNNRTIKIPVKGSLHNDAFLCNFQAPQAVCDS